jgi:hypothetical protein
MQYELDIKVVRKSDGWGSTISLRQGDLVIWHKGIEGGSAETQSVAAARAQMHWNVLYKDLMETVGVRPVTYVHFHTRFKGVKDTGEDSK